MREGEGGKDLDDVAEETENQQVWTTSVEADFAVHPVYCLLDSPETHFCSDTFRKFTDFNLMLL